MYYVNPLLAMAGNTNHGGWARGLFPLPVAFAHLGALELKSGEQVCAAPMLCIRVHYIHTASKYAMHCACTLFFFFPGCAE